MLSQNLSVTGIVIVEDDESALELLRQSFASCSHTFHLHVARSLREAREQLRTYSPSLVLANYRLPDGKGTDLVAELKKPCPVLLLTDGYSEQMSLDILSTGALEYFVKSSSVFFEMPRIVRMTLRLWNQTQNHQCVAEPVDRGEKRETSVTDDSMEGEVSCRDNIDSNHRYRVRGSPALEGNRKRGTVDYFGGIGELQPSDNRLEEQAGFLSRLLESLPLPVFYKDADGVYRGCNEAFASFIGESKEKIVGSSVYDLVPYDRVQVYHDADDALLRQGGAQTYSGSVLSKDGTRHEVIFHKATFTDATGHLAGIIGAIQDVTDSKRLQEALAVREQEFRSLAENLPDNICRFDRQGRILYVNPSLVRTLSIPAHEIVGRELTGNHIEVKEAFDRVIETGQAEYSVRQEIIVNGVTKLHNVSLVPEIDDDGNITSVLCIGRDMTDIYRLQDTITAREQEYRSLAESSPNFIIRYDLEGRTRYLNSELVSRLELSGTDEVIGKRPSETWPDGRYAAIEEACLRALETDSLQTIEAHEVTDSQTIRYFRVLVVPEKDATGRLIGSIAFGNDITEIRNAELKLKHFIDNLPGMACTFKVLPGGRIHFSFVSSGIRELCNLKPEDLKADVTPLHNIIHPDDQSDILAKIEEAARSLESLHVEARICRSGYPERWVHWRSTPIKEADGNILWHGLMLDITDLKQLERSLAASEEKHRTIFESANDGIFLHRIVEKDGDLAFPLHDLNRRGCELWGYTREEILNGGIDLLTNNDPPYDIKEATRRSRLAATGVPQLFEWQLKRNDGTIIWGEVNLRRSSISDEDFLLATVRDITERKRIEKQLHKREQEFRAMIENSPDPVVRYDCEGRRIYINPAMEKLLNKPAEKVIGLCPVESPIGGDVEAGRKMQQTLERVIKKGTPAEIELCWKDADSLQRCYLIRFTPEFDPQEAVATVLVTGRDISPLREHQRQLHDLAYYDVLTGMPNRRQFLEQLHKTIAGKSVDDQNMVGLMLVDLDRFKAVNDTFGHSIGDGLLCQVGKRLMQNVRYDDFVARLGGDEFAVILPNINSRKELAAIVRTLLKAFTESFTIEGKLLNVTVSIGIAAWPEDSRDASELMQLADTAMYHARDLGRNHFLFCSTDLSAGVSERLTLEAALGDAIKQQEFELYYQPKVELKSGKLVGAEALVRWQHPELGVLTPNRFIDIAEDTGLIVELGEWVLRTACLVVTEWNRSAKTPLKMAVNLSAKQFYQKELIHTIRSILVETGCEPEWLELEITESLLLEERDDILGTMNELRRMGCTTAMDDFGTGYSALGYLTKFPIDTLKIDRSFVCNILAHKDNALLVKAIVYMARALGMTLVAEGVETAQQASFLIDIGCGLAQGYLYGKPCPREQFEQHWGQAYTFDKSTLI